MFKLSITSQNNYKDYQSRVLQFIVIITLIIAVTTNNNNYANINDYDDNDTIVVDDNDTIVVVFTAIVVISPCSSPLRISTHSVTTLVFLRCRCKSPEVECWPGRGGAALGLCEPCCLPAWFCQPTPQDHLWLQRRAH